MPPRRTEPRFRPARAGTDCSDCPGDTACPGVGEERVTPCHLQGVPCAQYVQELYGNDHSFAQQCGLPESAEVCAASDCATVSAESAAASVLYITCPGLTTVLGAGMGYLFAVELVATVSVVMVFVLVTGGSCHSAWDNTRSVLRADLATEESESAALLDEEKRFGTGTPKVETARP